MLIAAIETVGTCYGGRAPLYTWVYGEEGQRARGPCTGDAGGRAEGQERADNEPGLIRPEQGHPNHGPSNLRILYVCRLILSLENILYFKLTFQASVLLF